MDKRIEIFGSQNVKMNGRVGVALDYHFYHYDRNKWRYTVKLDSGEVFKVKPAHVRAEKVAR